MNEDHSFKCEMRQAQTGSLLPLGSNSRDDERNRVSPKPSPELNCKTTGFTKALRASSSHSRVSVLLSRLRAQNIDRHWELLLLQIGLD
ncbi:hypothetical protein AV530_004232 [Patagioenas fasciata monilis]|uniref:Uncharacterized protein n=1 Tax=Patagioenas fasciata monilis TaxID=372326 RepID=A0A1V4K8W7_PATFA|nr:hypothetical protein AV530_004232 [Patagioenas fasciata monilis]